MVDDTRDRLAELVVAATDGEIGLADVLAADATLTALGLTSLGMMRLIDAIEDEFGVEFDLTGGFPAELAQTVDTIAGYLARA